MIQQTIQNLFLFILSYLCVIAWQEGKRQGTATIDAHMSSFVLIKTLLKHFQNCSKAVKTQWLDGQ